MPRWRGKMDDFDATCQTVEDGRENFINAIFTQAYDDLMFLYVMERRSPGSAAADIEQLENWFRNVLPEWRRIDPEEIIKKAMEESQYDPEAVFVQSIPAGKKIPKRH